jgi:hypothetical protein
MTVFQFTSGLVSFRLIHYSSNQVCCTDGPPTFLRLWRSRKSTIRRSRTLPQINDTPSKHPRPSKPSQQTRNPRRHRRRHPLVPRRRHRLWHSPTSMASLPKINPTIQGPPSPNSPSLARRSGTAVDGRRFCYLLVCGGVEVETDCSYCGGGGDKCGEEVSPVG